MLEDTPEDRPLVRRSPDVTKLSNTWRTLATVLGLGGLGAGATAIFTTEVEAGPVALLLVGVVLLFVAMSGRLPNRLKMGENEATWEQAVQEYVQQTVEEAPPEERAHEIARASELGAVAPQLVAPALGSVAFEQSVLVSLRQALLGMSDVDFEIPQPGLVGDRVYDAKITRSGTHEQLYVIVKGRYQGSAEIRELLDQLPEYSSIALIIRNPFAPRRREYLSNHARRNNQLFVVFSSASALEPGALSMLLGKALHGTPRPPFDEGSRDEAG